MDKITIDATNKKLGRLASEVAIILMGKNSPDYSPNKLNKITIEIINASKLDIDNKKMEEFYTHYTGYPSGLRYTPRKKVVEKHGIKEVILRAVKGMLPKNKLQKPRLSKIKIVE